jgi:hypothetical protein
MKKTWLSGKAKKLIRKAGTQGAKKLGRRAAIGLSVAGAAATAVAGIQRRNRLARLRYALLELPSKRAKFSATVAES